MTDNTRAEALLNEMLANPKEFDEQGRAYELLQYYFAGFPVETLRPMLRSGNLYLQRGASFIASELGATATSVVDDIVRLVDVEDGHTQWYAMEVLAVCCRGQLADNFLSVVRMLDSLSPPLRGLAERLMARADPSQLRVARRYFEDQGRSEDVQRWATRQT